MYSSNNDANDPDAILAPGLLLPVSTVASFGMANLPRWVPTRRVDSSAMLSGFLGYLGRSSAVEKEAVAHLYMVEHAMRKTVNIGGVELVPNHMPSPVPSIPCTTPGCERCLTQRGGYQFRWYSQLWEQGYRATRRPGSWLPGEPETDDVDQRPAQAGAPQRAAAEP